MVMTAKLNPYLRFNGDAREAMEFYKTVFGGELRLNTFGDYGASDAPIANNIMHAQLEAPSGFTLMASDTPPDMSYQPGDTMTISLSGDDVKELHRYWDKLSKSGQVTMPLEKQLWGDEFGMCTDQFGVPWMVDIVAQEG
jgi:PhnB protein